MKAIEKLRSVPIGVLSIANAILMLGGLILDLKVFGQSPRYSLGFSLIGVAVGAALPYLIVTREDSGIPSPIYLPTRYWSFLFGLMLICFCVGAEALERRNAF
jgi:hypothetical protein